jgi:DNA-binding transcriptional ArsR family regulator
MKCFSLFRRGTRTGLSDDPWSCGAVMRSWRFLTHHALVLLYVSRRPESTGLEIAQAVGVTERAVRSILGDLRAAGSIEREKIGRRNRYRVDRHRPMGRIGERELTVGQLLELVAEHEDSAGAK